MKSRSMPHLPPARVPPPEPPGKHPACRRHLRGFASRVLESVLESCWRGPAVFMAVYWGGAFLSMLVFWGESWTGRPCGGAGLVVACVLPLWLAVAVLPPALVVVQLVRRKWWTALATALLSAVALVPLFQVLFLMVLLSGGLAK